MLAGACPDSRGATGCEIISVEPRHYRVPLPEQLCDAGHGLHTHFELITCTLATSDGLEGTGYTYTGGRGGSAILSLIRDELAPLLKGSSSTDIEALWNKQRASLHYLGLGGITAFAVSACDIALWDLRGKRTGASLIEMAGGKPEKVRCYRGLIDLGYSDEYLLQRVAEEFASGHTAVKLKVGREDIARDIARVKSVRAQIGSEAYLMADANYSWTASQAIEFARGVEDCNLLWFEEPVSHVDLDAYAKVSKAIDTPLASGENWRTIADFKAAIATAGLTFLQPDASNIGGITGWLKVADLAQQHDMKITCHGMHELHVSLMAGREGAAPMELHSFPIDAYTTNPTIVEDGYVAPPTAPGTGVVFDDELLAPHLIS